MSICYKLLCIMSKKFPVGRPKNCRRVKYEPMVTCFKPAGIPLFNLDEIRLTVDELEAIRLADLKGLYQDSAASEMHISRQTFGRILVSAHKKIADSLVNGKALKIEGGEFSMPDKRTFQCGNCHHEWELPFGTGRPEECPKCKGKHFYRIDNFRGCGCRKNHSAPPRFRATHMSKER